MLKKTFFSLLISLMLMTYTFAGNKEGNRENILPWFGTYTIDDIPKTLAEESNCKIVNMGNLILESVEFISPEPDSSLPKCKNCYLRVLDKNIRQGIAELVKDAKYLGYNAILGLKIVTNSHFDGFQGRVINGNLGIGYGHVIVMGTPVKIICLPSKRKE